MALLRSDSLLGFWFSGRIAPLDRRLRVRVILGATQLGRHAGIRRQRERTRLEECSLQGQYRDFVDRLVALPDDLHFDDAVEPLLKGRHGRRVLGLFEAEQRCETETLETRLDAPSEPGDRRGVVGEKGRGQNLENRPHLAASRK